MSAFNTAQKDLEDYNSIPKLVLSVTSVATQEGGCFGWIDAGLEVDNITPAKTIWYGSRHIYYSGKDYTAKVIDPAASLIKTLRERLDLRSNESGDAIGR